MAINVANPKGLLKVVLLVYVLVLLGGKISTVLAQDVDLSTFIPCDGVEFPPPNNRICYETVVDDPFLPMKCKAEPIAITNQTVDLIPAHPRLDGYPQQTKVWSPGNLRGRNYQNSRICRYNVACPPGYLLHYGWLDGNFNLEKQDKDLGCLDYVQIENFDQENFFLCNSIGQYSERRTTPLKMEFRSNTRSRHLGFQMDIICVKPEFLELPGCKSVYDPKAEEARKKRAEIRPFVSQTGRTIHIDRDSYIEYEKNTIKIVWQDEVQRVIGGIKVLFFWTGINGTTGFYGKAPRHFIYGGGILRITRSVAYYSTVRIPPQFEPNGKELQMIGTFLNATRPFFVQQDVIDEPDATEEPPLEPIPSTPPRVVDDLVPADKNLLRSLPTSRANINFRRKKRAEMLRQRRNINTEMETGSGNGPAVDEELVAMAEDYQDACNIFLRESALAYLLLLEESGLRPQTTLRRKRSTFQFI